jgi:hypothetical protein
VASTAIAAVLAGPPRPARVLGASSTAVYLVVQGVDAAPEVVAIVAERAVHLPLGVAVPGQAPPVRDPGAVLVGGGAIALGRWSLVPARWVDPRPHLPGRPLGPRLEEVEDLLAVPAETAGVAAHPAIVVADGLRAGDPGPALALLGQGPGLTPAGDDVVAGAAAALAVLERLDAAAADAVVAAARVATTVLSAALLRCAVRGEVVPQAAELLRALCGHASPAAALDRLLGVGHTTGAALALGLCAGVRSALGG